ncbi:MAG: OmpA family protein [Vicinamibacterales bacterium]
MRFFRQLAAAALLAVCSVSPGWAQDQNAQAPSEQATRPASTTTAGDTGLWFVPLGETLPKGSFSVSAYRINFDRTEGFSDISDFTGTFAFGATERVEIFGAFAAQRRIDVDRRPLLEGGAPADYPLINQQWATGVGDLTIGAKINLLSQGRQNPAAFALRLAVIAPTADTDKGLGSGKVGGFIDAVVSREMNERVDLSGYAGVRFRGSPDEVDLSHGFRYGFGAGFPSRSPLKLFAEVNGEYYFDSTATRNTAVIQVIPGPDVLPATWDIDNPVDALIGVQYTAPNGFFAGAGFGYGLNTKARFGSFQDDAAGDRVEFQARIGYHPGVGIYVPPPPPPPPPAPPVNRPPTVTARCEPCTVQVGQQATVTAEGTDPDGDTLSYRWTGPTGAFANANDRQTRWTAPNQEGGVPLTVTVNDGKGGTATDTITIQVVQPPKKEYTFEDVHFDFDRYSLRPEATRLLDEVVTAMREDSDLRLTLEGHTCNIGTAEYNLALGERRANAVRDYLVSRGVNESRLQTVSYGEERPKHDNSREETRRLNRRAALTIRMQ